jgi:branched-chain amino acid transport system ATP-binding protein
MLEVQSLSAWWGGAQALFDVSLRVAPGELVVLQGLNGAGKSTLLKAVMGMGPRVEGMLRFGGQAIGPLAVHQRARLGLGYVPEDRRLFTHLTVRENLTLATSGGSRSENQMEFVLAMFPALKAMLKRSAGQMSGGEQQMLSIARTVMTAPKMLLLDEPCEGIAPVLIESITDALLALRAQALPMLIAEHNASLAGRADRLITLTAGQVTPS